MSICQISSANSWPTLSSAWPKRLSGAWRVAVAVLAVLLLGAAVSPAPSGAAARNVRSSTQRTSSGRVVVLGYHAIADLDSDPVLSRFSVPPARFAEHLDTLLRKGWTFVDLDTVLKALDDDGRLPDRAVLLTFDDAYTDLLDVACPILEERGIPAVAFAVTERLGRTNSWDSEDGAEELKLLCADGLRETAARGVEIGSHTATHPHLTEISPEQLEEELGGAADRLEALGLPRPRAFSYPYGLWNATVAQAVREAGYEVAFAVDRGTVRSGANRYALPRIAVHANDTGRMLHLKLATAELNKRVRTALRRIAPRRPS